MTREAREEAAVIGEVFRLEGTLEFHASCDFCVRWYFDHHISLCLSELVFSFFRYLGCSSGWGGGGGEERERTSARAVQRALVYICFIFVLCTDARHRENAPGGLSLSPRNCASVQFTLPVFFLFSFFFPRRVQTRARARNSRGELSRLGNDRGVVERGRAY